MGALRNPVPADALRVWVPRDLVCALDAYAHEHDLPSRTAALRAVITAVCPPVAVTWEPGKYVRSDNALVMKIAKKLGGRFSKREVMRHSNAFMRDPQRLEEALSRLVAQNRLQVFPGRTGFVKYAVVPPRQRKAAS